MIRIMRMNTDKKIEIWTIWIYTQMARNSIIPIKNKIRENLCNPCLQRAGVKSVF